ncbi:hypothetical protein N0M98_12165 [Paenibacillus doosanensis]|uniref:Uncharacterized protein n=1 Tax=Paenibacillus konkukensis TaxID=2020716 RepID=A0ABY4RVG3_9BACL|nr:MULTISPECIES: hypothetical protein [Paenibacillus]MCS7460898.1 hypothetical protein [Paenibacillus doosanensis]UQZ86322.1 hypothetical protein SK3146_05615 [Paenibacillus konkukensis]
MPRLLYEYIYVNMWILLFLTLMWANDGHISVFESVLLIAFSVTVMAFVGKKQVRSEGSGRYRKPPF